MVRLQDAHIKHRDGTVVVFPSFCLAEGEEAALVGPSGSGKSSLLHVLAGVLAPQAGTVEVCGVDVAQASPADRERLRASMVSMVFQDFHLLAGYSALENVMVALGLAKQPLSGAKALLERVGLEHRWAAKPHQLSTGERQRVALARALACKPRILLADEPTAHLDGRNTQTALDVLRRLAKDSGAGLLIATHDPLVMAQMPRVIEMQAQTPSGAA
jgi:putative ABC transport system ATP-binding protein